VFVIAQLGQGWVAAVGVAPEPEPDITGVELGAEGLPVSGVEDATIGAPHVSQ